MQTEKGPGRCLSVRERKGHCGTPLRSLSTYILRIAFRKKIRKKTILKKSEKERDTEGHYYEVYLLSSCVLNPVIEFENKKISDHYQFCLSTPCVLHKEMYEKHFFEEQVIYLYLHLKVFSNFKASGKGGKMRKYLTKSFVNENIMFIKSVTKSD